MEIINAIFGGNLAVTIILIAIFIVIFIMIKGKARYIIGAIAGIYAIGVIFNQQSQIADLIYMCRSFISTVFHIG